MFIWNNFKYEFISYKMSNKDNNEKNKDIIEKKKERIEKKSETIHYQNVESVNTNFTISNNKFKSNNSTQQITLDHNPIRTGIHRTRFKSVNDQGGYTVIGITDGEYGSAYTNAVALAGNS